MITPQTQAKNLAAALQLKNPLYLKCEDLHPLGSHKGRSLPFMIKKYAGEGWRAFVISSSGNAALATALYISELNRKNPENPLTLEIFLGENINEEKLLEIKKAATDKNISTQQVKNPKQSAFRAEKTGKTKNLRQSTDDNALFGYEELAKELAEIKDLSAVFIPSSSGTTAQGLYEGFKKLGLNPQIHIVQTDFCHPFVAKNVLAPSGRPLAGAIVDKVAHRKTAVLSAIKNSRGNGWMATNEEIALAVKLLKKTEKISISPNSALSLAGLIQALEAGQKFNGPIALLCTGR